MELLERKIEEIYRIEENWIDIVRDEMDNDKEPSNQDLVRVYNELWKLIRNSLKKDYDGTIEMIEAKIQGDVEWLLDDVKDSLQTFFALNALREKQENEEKVYRIIDYLFENVIVYYDPVFANDYMDLEFDEPEKLWNAARVLDGLIGFYMNRHYSIYAIERDLKEETGLNDTVCNYIAGKIKENYYSLQLNTLMDSIWLDKEDK